MQPGSGARGQLRVMNGPAATPTESPLTPGFRTKLLRRENGKEVPILFGYLLGAAGMFSPIRCSHVVQVARSAVRCRQERMHGRNDLSALANGCANTLH